MLPDNIENFSNQLADRAREIALKYFRKTIEIENKSDNSPVSIADKEIEQTLRTMIAAEFPNHGILGEEFETKATDSEFLWVIDPIDGTKSFICGHPSFGALISLLKDNRPILGIIEMPALKERWLGLDGKGTFFNDIQVNTKTTKMLADGICCTTGPDFFEQKELQIYNQVSQYGSFRLFGGDCYNYGLLASGHVDVVMEAGLKPFDFMALIPIIKNAGGIVTDWRGNQMTLESSGQILACANLDLHQQCLEQINKAQR